MTDKQIEEKGNKKDAPKSQPSQAAIATNSKTDGSPGNKGNQQQARKKNIEGKVATPAPKGITPQQRKDSVEQNVIAPVNKGNQQQQRKDVTGQKNAKASSAPQNQNRQQRNGRGKASIRRDVITSIVTQIKQRNLSSSEMLALIQALGITPIYTRFRNRDGESEIIFPSLVGPLQYLFGQIGNVTQRLATFRKLVFDGAKMSQKDLEFLEAINASDYDSYGNPVTPTIFLPVLEKVKEIFSEVNQRVVSLQSTRRNNVDNNVDTGKDITSISASTHEPISDASDILSGIVENSTSTTALVSESFKEGAEKEIAGIESGDKD